MRLAGAPGSGKTTLLSELAKARGYKLVYASQLSPKEIFAVLANQLRGVSADAAQQFATFEGAKHAFASAWAEASELTLVIDDSPYIDDIIEVAWSKKSTQNHQGRILYSTRDLDPVDSRVESIFHLPPMNLEQTALMLKSVRQDHTQEEAIRLWEVTKGNPLRIRQQLVSSGRSTKQVWQDLNPSQREIVTYLTIARSGLAVEDLLSLRNDISYGPENLFADVDLLPELTVGTGVGFRIVHEEIRDELWKLIAARPERIQFAAGRLSKFLEAEGRVVEAYFVLAKSGHKDAGRLLGKAAFEAARSGDWKSSISIQEELLKRAERRKDIDDAIHTRLALAQAYQISGNVNVAREFLERVRQDVTKASKEIRLFVEQFILSSTALFELTPKSVSDLEALKSQLKTAGREWHAARISIDLSVAYIHAHNAPAAEREAREALVVFEAVDDGYGFEIARRNLASALYAQGGRDQEADRLVREIELAEPDQDGRRSRAWLCNMLVRKNRKVGALGEAEENALEAINIARELGDEALVAVNQICLGNVLSDKKQFAEAIRAYDTAANLAQKCGRHEVEAQASYLAGDTYNSIPNDHPDRKSDSAERAELLSRHAIGLMRGTIAYDHMWRAYDTLADALYDQGRKKDAVDAQFQSATYLLKIRDWDNFERLFMTACHNAADIGPLIYLKGIGATFGLDTTSKEDSTLLERLYEPLDVIFRELPPNVLLPFFGLHLHLMSRHLPAPVTRRLVDLIFDLLRSVAKERPDEPWRVVYPAITLAAGCSASLTIQDFVRIAQNVSEFVPDLHIRQMREGDCRWTVVLSLPSPVAISISQIDDEKPTVLACLVLWLFLKGFEAALASELLGGVTLLNEIALQIANGPTMPPDLQRHVAASLKETPCVVSRPANIEADDVKDPTLVFLSETFLADLSIGQGRGGALQILFGLTAIELAYRLLRGTVDIEALGPKVTAVVKQSIS